MEGINRILSFPIDHLPFVFLVIVVAFTLHEFAHAYLAYKFGDDTAYRQGRVTLDPRAHFDVLGTIMILIAGFGWAKPVPVMRSRFRNPWLMGILVSFAGPFSNLLLAFVGVVAEQTLAASGALDGASQGVRLAVEVFFFYFIGLNGFLFFFNLLPLPPLDGFRIVEDLLPLRLRARIAQYEQWGFLLFLVIVFIPPLNQLVIRPLYLLNAELIDAFRALVGG